MPVYRVSCKEKHSRYERIASIGCVEVGTGAKSRFTEDEAIRRIKLGTDSFYVERPEGHRVAVIVAEREGREYLKTETDGEKPDNLLSLPDCPAKPSVPPSSGSGRVVVPAGSHGISSTIPNYCGA
ncbi:MAG: DUF3892 domain-containing protein [Terracidiphilus sp.]|nr:DUF3892 domain-containing protein [Terracidiphilus sp.]